MTKEIVSRVIAISALTLPSPSGRGCFLDQETLPRLTSRSGMTFFGAGMTLVYKVPPAGGTLYFG